MNNDCVFCKIVKGELPAKFILKGKDFVAFEDIQPIDPVHVLIVPKKHIESLSSVKDSDKNILGEIQAAIPKIAKKLKISKAFRLLCANGENAGQTVSHLHYHLIGGWKFENIKMETDPSSLRT